MKRRSRAKQLSDRDLAREEHELATGDTSVAPGIDYGPWIRPNVDREALLRAVDYHHFDFMVGSLLEHKVKPESAERWRKLCRIRAIQRELASWTKELGAEIPTPTPGGPRSRPVSKAELFRLSMGREPKNTAEASRWFAREAAPFVFPDPSDANFRGKVTVDVFAAAEWLGVQPARLR